jgi:hypothetical protein
LRTEPLEGAKYGSCANLQNKQRGKVPIYLIMLVNL